MGLNRHNIETIGLFGGNLGIDGNEIRYRPFYELTFDSLRILDPIWGEELIGEEQFDQLLVELAHTDALRRMQTIEQLTLPEGYATIPDSYYFSRWEHMWGSLIKVRRMSRIMGLDAEESMYLQLKVLLSDFKHTAFSHGGDWMFQGEGGAENQHEDRKRYAETVGIYRLLQLRGFDPQRVFDDSTLDITDVPSNPNQPSNLDVDRIDYTLRESNRWVDQSPAWREHLNDESFTVKNGRLVAKTKEAAKMFATSYALLVTQNWQEPAHRLQLNMFLESLKRIFVARNGREDDWGSRSPVDLMGTADHVLLDKFSEFDEFTQLTDQIMRSVSHSERMIRWKYRRDVAQAAIDSVVGGSKIEPVEWVVRNYDLLPANLEIEQVKPSQELASGDDYHLIIPLRKLRRRFVDPEFIDAAGEVVALSTAEPQFMEDLSAAVEAVQHDWQATLIHNQSTTKTLRTALEGNRMGWPEVMSRRPLSSEAVRSMLRLTVSSAQPYVRNFIELSVISR